MENVHECLNRIPTLKGRENEVVIKRLGGLTNRVYQVSVAGEDYVLRVPGKGTEDFIDRKAEQNNLKAIAEIKISADVLFYDDRDGLMLTRHIPGQTANPDYFKSTPGAIARTARTLRDIHECPNEFDNHFTLFDYMDAYQGVLENAELILPFDLYQAMARVHDVKQALAEQPLAPVPSHCDPSCENFIDDGKRVWAIDWEYSAMNDPMWDLGYLSVEGEFDEVQDTEMMEAYFGKQPSSAEQGRMMVYKAMSDLLSALWGLVQQANGNPVEDFQSFAMKRYDRCKKLMDSPEFATYLAAMTHT